VKSGLYDSFRAGLVAGEIHLAQALRVLLVTAGYEPDFTRHKTTADVGAFEAAGRGYLAGGRILPGHRLDGAALYAEPVVWPRAFLRARAAILATEDGLLVGCADFGAERESNGGPFEVVWRDGLVFNLK
jgi:hypothetical protein